MILIKSHYEDLVCINPNWLCGTVIGTLLSIEFVARARVTGCYSIEDFQSAFPEADSLNILHVLEALQLCTQVNRIHNKTINFHYISFLAQLAPWPRFLWFPFKGSIPFQLQIGINLDSR